MAEKGESLNQIEKDNCLEKLFDKLVVITTLPGGVTKYEIPDKIFTGDEEVEVDGKRYTIYSPPRILDKDSRASGHSWVMSKAIERFIKSNEEAPKWSQVITCGYIDEYNHLAEEPKILFIC